MAKLVLTLKDSTVEKVKRLAAFEGVTLKGYLKKVLRDIAAINEANNQSRKQPPAKKKKTIGNR